MSDETKSDPQALVIQKGIEQTRGDMSRTVNEIEERLSPARIEQQVEQLKESVLGNYHEVKDHLKDDISRELRDAKAKVKEEMIEAKEAVQDGFDHARTAVRQATVGKVEDMVQDARHMVHDARETVTEAGSSVLGTIKANPIPAALVAVGLGWLIMSARSSTPRITAYGATGYGPPRTTPRRLVRKGQRAMSGAVHSVEEGAVDLGHRVQAGASRVAGKANGLVHDVGERVGSVAHEVGDRVTHLAHDVEHLAVDTGIRGRAMVRGAGRQIVRAERGLEGIIRENPLAAGAVCLAVGAAIGLSLPHTQREDEWMGAIKERFVERAEGVAGEALHKIEETVTAQLGTGEEGGEEEASAETARKPARNGIAHKNGRAPTKSSAV